LGNGAGEGEVLGSETAGVVGGEGKGDLVVRQGDVGVVVEGLGGRDEAVDELDRGGEVGETERAVERLAIG